MMVSAVKKKKKEQNWLKTVNKPDVFNLADPNEICYITLK